MSEYPFDISQVPQGGEDTSGINFPLGTRYLLTSLAKCHFHQFCGVEEAFLVATLSDKHPKPNSSMDREGYWWTLCPDHYERADYLPGWPAPCSTGRVLPSGAVN